MCVHCEGSSGSPFFMPGGKPLAAYRAKDVWEDYLNTSMVTVVARPI